MRYRQEVDGLRAIAIVPVILFHAGFTWFSGGYVGVDVFFVISGYLITSLILAEHAAGTFSILTFYERRARRILPALLTVAALSTIPAWLWMFPYLLEDFGQSLMAVGLFGSNFLFWKESDYFNPAAEEKPLLHTWSLAVEEQYYVFFPLLLALLWFLGRRRLSLVVALLALLSVAISEWGWRNAPTANFYLMPGRAWELLLGALVAFSHHGVEDPVRMSLRSRNVLSILGLGMVLFSVFVYDSQTPFPSLYALVPAVGTALMLAFAWSDTWIGKVLSVRGIVMTGLVSYSLYLWHQPLFAFARIAGTPSATLYVGLILAAVVLAYLTWRFIEAPFRNRAFLSRNAVFALSAAGTLVLVGMGYVLAANHGFDSRITAGQRTLLDWTKYPRRPLYREGKCFLTGTQQAKDFAQKCFADPHPALLVWGDSHGAHLYPGFAAAQTHVAQLTSASCPPVMHYPIVGFPFCEATNDFVMRRILTGEYPVTIVAANWPPYYAHGDFRRRLAETLKALAQAPTHAVLIGPVAHWPPSLPERAARMSQDGTFPERVPADSLHQMRKLDAELKALARETGVSYFSALDAFCDATSCRAAASADRKTPMAWDYGHLTKEGSEIVAARILKELDVGAGNGAQ